MGLIWYTRGQTSIIVRVKIFDSSSTTGDGLTGLTKNSAGLRIAAIADNEATTTAYTSAAGEIEDIATLGTYVAPTTGKCRFKEVDAVNHKGIYELQLEDSRFAVAGATYLLISIAGATDAADTDVVIPLTVVDPFATNFNATALAAESSVALVYAVAYATYAGTISATTEVTNDEAPTVDEIAVATLKQAGFYNDHQITFTSGVLFGLTRIVTSHTKPGAYSKFAFDEPLPTTPTAGDGVTIKADHQHSRTQIANEVDSTLSATHGAGVWEAGAGIPGGIEWTITVKANDGSPLGNVAVWATTDAAGNNIVAGTEYTDDFGEVTFTLTAGTYYLWRNSPKYRFNNPQTMVVA